MLPSLSIAAGRTQSDTIMKDKAKTEELLEIRGKETYRRKREAWSCIQTKMVARVGSYKWYN